MSRYMTLRDLDGVAEHLLEHRVEALHLLLSGAIYESGLRRLRGKAQAASPRRSSGPRPFAVELKEADGLHDGLGLAVWHMVSAYQAHPTLEASVRAQAEVVMQTFIAERAELQASYHDEALNARERAPKVEEQAEALRTFPVVGGTLEDWVRAFVAAGLRIHALLQQRAEAEESPVDSEEARLLRSEILGLLTRLRGVVRDELSERPELPRNLEGRLFAYFDQVAALREAAATRQSPTPGGPVADEG